MCISPVAELTAPDAYAPVWAGRVVEGAWMDPGPLDACFRVHWMEMNNVTYRWTFLSRNEYKDERYD